MTIMVHSANANAPKNGDSIESPPPFPIFLHHSNNFCICAILRIYLRFAVMYTLRTSFRSDSRPTTLHPQKHAIHAINPTSRIDYTLPKSLYPALMYRACALRFHAVHLTVALEIEFISGYANDDTVRLLYQSWVSYDQRLQSHDT